MRYFRSYDFKVKSRLSCDTNSITSSNYIVCDQSTIQQKNYKMALCLKSYHASYFMKIMYGNKRLNCMSAEMIGKQYANMILCLEYIIMLHNTACTFLGQCFLCHTACPTILFYITIVLANNILSFIIKTCTSW